MAKVIKDTEMLDIIGRAINGDEIDDAGVYEDFLESLAKLICEHFGGEPGYVSHPDFKDPRLNKKEAERLKKTGELGWTVSFYPNESLPEDGGVFGLYDTDITWKDGEEIEN